MSQERCSPRGQTRRHIVGKIGTGTLSIGPAPDAGKITDWISGLKHVGVTDVLSLLEPDEAKELGLESEAKHLTDVGIRFRHLSIKDYGVPEIQPFFGLIADLQGRLEQGAVLHVHCRGGIGRSGLVACGLLMAKGRASAGAIAEVSERRGFPIPETPEQIRFIQQFGLRLDTN